MEKATRHLKGLFTPLDLLDDGNIVREENCYTLQNYHYECHRTRNNAGRPYGRIVNTMLTFTLRLPHLTRELPFYQQMKDLEPLTFTFLFNATFDGSKQLSNYDDALTVKGYVVDVSDSYGSATPLPRPLPATEQASVTVQMLLSSLTYVGVNSNKQLTITQ